MRYVFIENAEPIYLARRRNFDASAPKQNCKEQTSRKVNFTTMSHMGAGAVLLKKLGCTYIM